MSVTCLAVCAMQGDQWWRLRCKVLDSTEQPLNASAMQSATCPPGHQGPRRETSTIASCLPLQWPVAWYSRVVVASSMGNCRWQERGH